MRRLAPVVHTAPKTMSPLSFSSKWRWLNGHSHGLPQRTLIGQARVRSPAQQVLSTLDDLLSSVVPVAELPPAEGTGGQPLVRRFFWWVGEIQRHARLAVSPDLHLRALAAPDPQGYQVFEVALSDGRRVDPATGRAPRLPSTVDLETGSGSVSVTRR